MPMPGGFQPKKTALQKLMEEQEAAKREKAALQTINKETKPERSVYIEPDNPSVTQKIRIIFDDSGSMMGAKIQDARQGCIEFLRNCEINKVACAVHPMNVEPLPMETNLPELAELIKHIEATGGTPMYKTLTKAQNEEIKATRYIIFSDGSPTDGYRSYSYSETTSVADPQEACILKAIEAKTPIDTVWITEKDYACEAKQTLKELAERTGGFFLIFDRNKVNFAQAFKYLSPGLRHLLASDIFVGRLQEGKV